MKGFQIKARDGKSSLTLYISNIPLSGHVSVIFGKNVPTLLDLKQKDVIARMDIPEKEFKKLWSRVESKLPAEEIIETEVVSVEIDDPERIKRYVVEHPSSTLSAETAVKRRGRKKAVHAE